MGVTGNEASEADSSWVPWVLETIRGDWTWSGSSGGTEGFSAGEWYDGFAFRSLAVLLAGERFSGMTGSSTAGARAWGAEEGLPGLAE